MADTSTPERPGKRLVKVLIIFVIIFAVLAVGLLALADRASDGTNNNQPAPADLKEEPTTSPDAVKESGSPNSDTAPSSTGTGPGSDNSLLSQPPTE